MTHKQSAVKDNPKYIRPEQFRGIQSQAEPLLKAGNDSLPLCNAKQSGSPKFHHGIDRDLGFSQALSYTVILFSVTTCQAKCNTRGWLDFFVFVYEDNCMYFLAIYRKLRT